MIKEQDLKVLASQNEIECQDDSTIVGVVFPKKMSYVLMGVAANFTMKYYVINFNNDGIVLAALNNVTGKIDSDSLLQIKQDEITSVDFKKNLLNYELTISTTNGGLGFKVNKTMVGASWHKQNLASIIAKY